MASSEMAALTLSSTKERRVGLAALGKLRLSARSPSVVLTVRAMAVVVTTVMVREAVVAMAVAVATVVVAVAVAMVAAMVVVLEAAMAMVAMMAMAMAMAMVAVVTETGMTLAGWGRTAGRRRNQFIGRESGAQGEMAVVKSCPEVRQR
jgi:hypothetical protein